MLLKTTGLRAGYGPVPVLSNVSIEVHAGRITALLGANGAGKTTLFRALCGAIRWEGDIRVAGQGVRGLRPEQIARLGVGHVPEGRGTFADLTVEENLRVGGFARKDRSGLEGALERVYAWLPRLAERRKQAAGSLSGGEQQMVAIGRALIAQPTVLLLDEPTFGLAPRIAMEVINILRRLQAETPMAILLAEQNMALALKVADDGYVLGNGKVLASGHASELKESATVREAYLGSV
ncbi:ABC transporter ATP-binding protein [Piscinibacter sp. HJYY11]|uniref:ABC transporter ATP-binding protein n=1 Tax=Piscinibacter sp. HJYY11 TaxID=2801333 RepID=UPI002873D42E|nr:ABC transporter ATP-binding protein [Piscinibacter sp. HJYY11]